MIEVRIGTRAAGRPGCVGLVLGLVVLITVHLTSAVHGSSFEGPHVDAVTATCAQQSAGDDGRIAPPPGHDHKADGHIDHAADRPRTVSAGDTVLEPGSDGPAPISAIGTGGAAPRDPPGVTTSPYGRSTLTTSPYGRSTLALHCVWRQ
ncbi:MULTISPECIES: hypothetical protein [unclassified Streptomyces]|uniref:hypothetical protein n=1 Tax=unclassified Streptomyces TaxID=2593676 RepID=UPI002DDB5ABD|nr:hypothetical protein [Streptomyces sp. NBC_00243]WRZ17372.1 hypothetical protein OHT59_02200 [Streptomyces sp. NBC_00243]